MALLTKTGKQSLTFSGNSLAFPASEKMSMELTSSLAHNRHTPILGEGPKFEKWEFKVEAGGVLFIGPPGDAAIPRQYRVV